MGTPIRRVAPPSVIYEFVKKHFDWSVTEYSDVTSLFALVTLCRSHRLAFPAQTFSFWAACEALVPVLGDVMSSQVFNASINALP
ncbi:uncharacterized protein LOC114828038 [Galendromus occidentalis]|uniref:Uncharacterized protein LOC114828038 n=1 Tax=Galendromus occidentalis TaxID=34638 RepID=A0AAJ7SD72_9ACAR|nr:uncharacterized protein LOC114828038 [Galendromus occidentalis]